MGENIQKSLSDVANEARKTNRILEARISEAIESVNIAGLVYDLQREIAHLHCDNTLNILTIGRIIERMVRHQDELINILCPYEEVGREQEATEESTW